MTGAEALKKLQEYYELAINMEDASDMMNFTEAFAEDSDLAAAFPAIAAQKP